MNVIFNLSMTVYFYLPRTRLISQLAGTKVHNIGNETLKYWPSKTDKNVAYNSISIILYYCTLEDTVGLLYSSRGEGIWSK